MRHSLFFFARVAVLILAAVWLAERPGTVSIDWQGWRVDTSVGILALAALLLAFLSIGLFRLWRLLRDGTGSFGRFRQAGRQRRGYQALSQGLLAVAAGDSVRAEKLAKKAKTLLDDPALPLLLSVQAAQLKGDQAAAAQGLEAMLALPETEFAGLRGLLTLANRAGNVHSAAELAQRALALQPRATWPALALLELEAREGHWTDATAALETALKTKAISKEDGRRHRAALLTERARLTAASHRQEEAGQLAQQAHDLDPALVPAAALLARLKAQSGDARGARRVLEQAWRSCPHPDLAAIWGEVDGPAPDSLTRVKRYEGLVALDECAVEGHLALATVSISARLWGQARNHLNIARERSPTVRVFRLFADLAQVERGDPLEVRDWQLRQAAADPDPAWICSGCGTVHPSWSASCRRCGGFNTIHWVQPVFAGGGSHPVSGTAAGGPALIGSALALPAPGSGDSRTAFR
jgi:HemY protein